MSEINVPGVALNCKEYKHGNVIRYLIYSDDKFIEQWNGSGNSCHFTGWSDRRECWFTDTYTVAVFRITKIK